MTHSVAQKLPSCLLALLAFKCRLAVAKDDAHAGDRHLAAQMNNVYRYFSSVWSNDSSNCSMLVA